MKKQPKKGIDYVSIKERLDLNGHNSFLILLTGLSAAGKSTLAYSLERKLFEQGIKTYVLDGDVIRKGLNKDLGFDPESRSENNRRVGEIAKLLIDAGIVVLAAFIAPYEKDRECIKNIVDPGNYIEIFVNTSLEECEKRDPKGLYKNARLGVIPNMTGVTAPYEAPKNPNVEITENNTMEESLKMIYKAIKNHLKLEL